MRFSPRGPEEIRLVLTAPRTTQDHVLLEDVPGTAKLRAGACNQQEASKRRSVFSDPVRAWPAADQPGPALRLRPARPRLRDSAQARCSANMLSSSTRMSRARSQGRSPALLEAMAKTAGNSRSNSHHTRAARATVGSAHHGEPDGAGGDIFTTKTRSSTVSSSAPALGYPVGRTTRSRSSSSNQACGLRSMHCVRLPHARGGARARRLPSRPSTSTPSIHRSVVPGLRP